MRFDCAVGCGSSGPAASDSVSGGAIPPDGWITISYSVASPEPPYQVIDQQFSAVVCSTDCAYAFLSRQRRSMAYSVGFKKFGADLFSQPETRADVALRIGELVLEAIDEMTNDQIVLLPLDQEIHKLTNAVVLAFHPLLADVQEALDEATN